MKVKAKPGIKVPVENRPHVYIEQVPVEIAPSLYYRRLLLQGDLIEVNETRSKETRLKEKKEPVNG